MDPRRVIFFTEASGGACARYRAHIPIQAMNERGWFCRASGEWQPKMLDEFSIFVFQRINQREGIHLIEELNKVNKVTVYDIDDDLLHIPASSPVYALMLEHADMVGNQIMAMARCQHITVTTETLRSIYSSFCSNVTVVPNYVRLNSWINIFPLRFSQDADTVVLGWAGSNTHRDALELLRVPLLHILDRYSNVLLVVMGDALPYDLPTHRYIVIPWGKYRLFQSVVLGWDIGLAPLGPTVFNLSKSNLRLLEIGTAGKACVASRWGEYERFIQHGHDGFLCSSPAEWIEALSTLIENENLRKTFGMNLQQKVRGFDIYQCVDERIALYDRMLAEKGLL